MSAPSNSLGLLRRRLVAVPGSHQETPAVTLFWWNMLAQTLSLPSKDFPKPPFPHTDPAALSWDYRAPRILAVILEHSPSVVGLCEVDGNIYSDFLLPELTKKGYAGFWSKKFSDLADGVALFWKTDAFALDRKEVFQLNGKDSQIALLAHLTPVSGAKPLAVAVTHLKAKFGFEELRASQVKSLCARLRQFNPDQSRAVVMGDFNDNPDSAACAHMKMEKFASAYKLLKHGESASGQADEAPWTTWKKRESVMKHTIDYIWLQESKFELQQVLEIPKDELLPKLLPAAYFPSDHLNLVAVVTV